MSPTQFMDSIGITASKELKLFVRSMVASYQFIFQQEKFELVQKADMLELIDRDAVGNLALRFAAVAENTRMNFTRQELYVFYTMIDLVCRSFLCDIGDEYKAITMKLNKVNEEKYNAVRNTELSIAQALLQKIRSEFSADPDFEEILERLEMLD